MSSSGHEGAHDATGNPIHPTRSAPRPVIPHFFNVIHLYGDGLIDQPLGMQLDALDTVPGGLVVDRMVTGDLATAEAFTTRTLAAGHEE